MKIEPGALEPFSFVFLLFGNNQYHWVWNTLDTKEATYIWHIEKSIFKLEQSIKQIGSLKFDFIMQIVYRSTINHLNKVLKEVIGNTTIHLISNGATQETKILLKQMD